MTTQNTPNSSEQYETIKLGIDAHAMCYYVSRQVDGLQDLHSRPPQRKRSECGRVSAGVEV